MITKMIATSEMKSRTRLKAKLSLVLQNRPLREWILQRGYADSTIASFAF